MKTIDELFPKNTPEYMMPAWLGCLSWALGNPEILAAFRAETGRKWTPGMTPLDRMIDESTGVDREFIEAFVVWVNENIWGDPTETPSEENAP